MVGKPHRRLVVSGLGAVGVAGAAGLLYRAAPGFWQQYRLELKRQVAPAPRRPQVELWPVTGLHAAWIGHSTVLLKLDGFTILTDPVFSEWCGLNVGITTLGLKRLVEPALALESLPPIDLVLLSHAHMDHFDLPSLRQLEHERTTVITARRTSDLLRVPRYRRVQEVGWGEESRVGPVTVRAFEVNHWGARYRTDNYRGYNGYVIETARHRVIFGGDTAHTDLFRKAKSATRRTDLAIMPIGAYNPWIHYHCTPEQAVRMANDTGADAVLPVHHQTFLLSREPLGEPITRLREALHDEQRVALAEIGGEWSNRTIERS